MKNEEEKKLSREVNEIMTMFYEVNPAINFANKTSRTACIWMLKRWGIDTVKSMAKQVIKCQGMPFAPVACDPYQMKNKLFKFKLYFERNGKPKPKIYEG